MELLKTYRFINSHLECEGEIEMEAQEKKKIDLVSNNPVVDEKSYSDYVEVLHEKICDKDVKIQVLLHFFFSKF